MYWGIHKINKSINKFINLFVNKIEDGNSSK